MFCSTCGTQLPDNSKFCDNCGTATDAPVQTSGPVYAPPNSQVYQNTQQPTKSKSISQITIGEIGQSIKLNAQDEDMVYLVIAKKTININLIIKIIALALCVLFFFPMFSVSCQGIKISFNGWDSAFGKTIESSLGSMFSEKKSDKINGNFMAIFLFLVPAILFIMFQFKKNLSFIKGKLFFVSTGLSAIGVMSFITYAIAINNAIEKQMGDIGKLAVKFTFWYYLSIILYILTGLTSVVSIISLKKKKVRQNNGTIPSDGN